MEYKLQKQYRLPKYDYSSLGQYFITICTGDRKYFFGDIINYKMRPSEIGKIVEKFYFEIPRHFENVKLDKWVVMPNHVHGIITIMFQLLSDVPNGDDIFALSQNTIPENITQNDAMHRSYRNKSEYFSNLSPKSKSISRIIGSFKSVVTKNANLKFPEINFTWQSKFYDHIIRNDKELEDIRHYIHYNPLNWRKDRNNLEGLLM